VAIFRAYAVKETCGLMEFVINADTDEILGAPLLRIDAREIIKYGRCRRAARCPSGHALRCDPHRPPPHRSVDAVLVTVVRADEPQVGQP
jgi:pyruvate/2-oxoglutarate dehydrogenase complex dihydrolipoamide dehydrogenase (E3) component